MTTAVKRQITRDDLIPVEQYAAERRDHKATITAVKRNRRLEVGPFATFYFESYETMWHQIQEMLYIERGGEEQMADELAAYNPLIPQGRELVATVMFEIDDPVRRENVLGRLGGVEETLTLKVGDHTIVGAPEEDVDRTNAAGKASSVQFVHFPFTDAEAAAFKAEGAQVIVGVGHENYAHMAVMPEAVRQALSQDFD